jgi:hypothetical protein
MTLDPDEFVTDHGSMNLRSAVSRAMTLLTQGTQADNNRPRG